MHCQPPHIEMAGTVLTYPRVRLIRGYVNIRLAITMVQATHRCIWGGRVPAPLLSVTRPR